jgi:hypothetical protein
MPEHSVKAVRNERKPSGDDGNRHCSDGNARRRGAVPHGELQKKTADDTANQGRRRD